MLVKELLTEARKDDCCYELVKVKGVVQKVVVKLEGSKSGSFTVLAQNFRTLHDQINTLDKQLEARKSELKGKMEEYFDAEDEVLTRVLETCSISMTMSKATPPGTSVDYEVAFNSLVTQLAEMVPELQKKIEKLQDAAVKAASKPSAGRKSGFKVEPVKEGVMSSIAGYFKNLLSSLKTWGTKYDAKLAKLKALSLTISGKPGKGHSHKVSEAVEPEYKVVKTNFTKAKGEIVGREVFLDARAAWCWIPSKDPARGKLKALKVGEEFSYSNDDTGYNLTVKRIS